MYASLLISLLAAFIAMLGKQWLNRYLRNSGGSVIERCGDRQRKYDGLKQWRLHFLIESLPVMLQVALSLLACGLYLHMQSINTLVAHTLIGLTGSGALFYLAIGIAGTSYACPFQTPLSIFLRGSWGGVRSSWVWLSTFLRRLPQPTTIPLGGIQVQEPRIQTPLSTTLRDPWKIVRHGLRLVLSPVLVCWDLRPWPFPPRPSQQTTPSLNDDILPDGIEARTPEPWLKPGDLDAIRTANANDAGCVSWIINHITDPEALEAAIRLAGTIQWFDDGINAEVPYGSIVSTFEACFDLSGKLYPGSRDMARYSGRVIVSIRGLARCKFGESEHEYPFPSTKHEPGPDPDLRHLLYVDQVDLPDKDRVAWLLVIDPEHTPSHMQWASELLLGLSWATRLTLDYEAALDLIPIKHKAKVVIPLNAILNRLLVWCIFLGSPPAEEVLKVRNKSCDTSYFVFQNTHSALD